MITIRSSSVHDSARIPEAAPFQCRRVAGVLDVKTPPAGPSFPHRPFTAKSILPSLVTRSAAIPYGIPAASTHRAGRSSLRRRAVPQHPLELPATAIARDCGRVPRPSPLPSSPPIPMGMLSPAPGRTRRVRQGEAARASPAQRAVQPGVAMTNITEEYRRVSEALTGGLPGRFCLFSHSATAYPPPLLPP